MLKGKKLFAAALAVLALVFMLNPALPLGFAVVLFDLFADSRAIASGLIHEINSLTEEELEQETITEASSSPSLTEPTHIPVTSSPSATSVSSSGTDKEEPNIVPTTIYRGLAITNATDYEIDVIASAAVKPSLSLSSDGPQILIIHTHGSEAYTSSADFSYEETDTDRTEDMRFNVIRVGDELEAAFESYGIDVVHDRELYDYPSYTGSYTRSGAAIEEYLMEYPSIKIVIDLHRDALGSDGIVYKTMAEIEDETSSQVMLLVGTDGSGLDHPDWMENLTLALHMQNAMIEKYPTLARPVALVNERYNQHLTTGSLILEVGSNGNTLPEALCAVRLFADAVAPSLLALSGL